MAEPRPVNVEAGASLSPSMFQRVVDEKGDLHDDEKKDDIDESKRAIVGCDEGVEDPSDDPPVFAFCESFWRHREKSSSLGFHRDERKDNALDRHDGSD